MSKILIASTLATLSIALSSAGSYAQDAGLSNIYECKRLSSDAERLACYDNAVAGLEAMQQNDDLVTLKRSDIEKVKKQSFGLSPSNAASKIDELVENAAIIKAPTVETNKIDQKDKVEEKQDRKKKGIDDADEVVLTLRDTKIFGKQKVRFYFTNGQVWDQVDSYQMRAPRIREGKVTTAEIRKAAFGSYLLQVNGKGRAVRVRRTR